MLKKEDVLHIADLAKLYVSDIECDLYQKDLSEIIEFASRISDSESFVGKETSLDFKTLRDDFSKQEFERSEMLINAPESENGYFLVPKVIADE